MYGDFARVTFKAKNNRSRVLMQQGRVQLEADWNEQGAIFLHLLRTLARDVFGRAGGPNGHCGFGVITRRWLQSLDKDDQRRVDWEPLLRDTNAEFLVGPGHYYVDGVLCDNPAAVRYSAQPGRVGAMPEPITTTVPERKYLVYLDVAEHSVFAAEDDTLLEVAIGIETTIRARQSWVVRTIQLDRAGTVCDDIEPSWKVLLDRWQSANRGLMKCRAGKASAEESSEPCIVAPQSRYRGPENQLYRVEVHDSGVIDIEKRSGRGGKSPQPINRSNRPTFKFSRVNGSAVYRIESFSEPVVTLADLRLDSRLTLNDGDWVEILDDTTILSNAPGPLRRVASIDTFTRTVKLDPADGTGVVGRDPSRHPILRRWDQRHHARVDNQRPAQSDKSLKSDEKSLKLELEKGVAAIELGVWIHLEDGVEIQFEAPATATESVVFRSGDYWLVPARVATGGVIDWRLNEEGEAIAIKPDGVEHLYAPLAVLTVEDSELRVHSQCRRVLDPPGKTAQDVFGTISQADD